MRLHRPIPPRRQPHLGIPVQRGNYYGGGIVADGQSSPNSIAVAGRGYQEGGTVSSGDYSDPAASYSLNTTESGSGSYGGSGQYGTSGGDTGSLVTHAKSVYDGVQSDLKQAWQDEQDAQAGEAQGYDAKAKTTDTSKSTDTSSTSSTSGTSGTSSSDTSYTGYKASTTPSSGGGGSSSSSSSSTKGSYAAGGLVAPPEASGANAYDTASTTSPQATSPTAPPGPAGPGVTPQTPTGNAGRPNWTDSNPQASQEKNLYQDQSSRGFTSPSRGTAFSQPGPAGGQRGQEWYGKSLGAGIPMTPGGR
jgi:hypothetical protein